jgi:cellulose biosynthesis protein BcsQ
MSDVSGKGKIITFYSYKGGTGRSMALANVAWILASQGKQVLVIDWDLEAPGLHRYFHPFLIDPDLTSTEGLIDFVWDFAMESVTPTAEGSVSSGSERLAAAADLAPYTVGLDYDFGKGSLDFIPAGCQGLMYSSRVNSFNWENFYGRLGGGILLEEVRRRLKHDYDFILIDSRTGVSDTSGVCTVQMPDQLVVCFTCNNQSMTGSAAVVESILEQRERAGRRGDELLQIFPVLMRVDLDEKDKLDASRKFCRKVFFGFPNHLEGKRREQYWRKSEVLYHSYYAYEEILATFGDSTESDKTLLSDMETLTGHLTDQEVVELHPIPESRRLECRARYLRSHDGSSQTMTVTGAPDLIDPEAIDLYERVKASKEEWEKSGRSPVNILPAKIQKELSYAFDVRNELLKREGYPAFLEQSTAIRPYRRASAIIVSVTLVLAIPVLTLILLYLIQFLIRLLWINWRPSFYGTLISCLVLVSAALLTSSKYFFNRMTRFLFRFRRAPSKTAA